jgi:acyl-CoA hydrolase
MNDKIKFPRESRVEMTELVLPNDTNLLSNLLGGRLMHWMDVAGGMAASRHSNCVVVTAAVDNLTFHHPIRLGELVNITAVVTWTGRTSMEVLIRVFAENTMSGEKKLANEAFFTFVAMDENSQPTGVARLQPETENEKQLFKEASQRREKRLQEARSK